MHMHDNKKTFRYQLLSRLKMDCDYFLGYGNRSVNALWGGSVEIQINKMKELWLSFTEPDKPEWLAWEDILDYEKNMLES